MIASPSIPALPPRYRLLDLIGQGGMGRVFRAEDRETGAIVALKVVRTAGDEDRRRFEREARTLSRLQHEGIVRLFDVGAAGGEVFFTMEHLRGLSLASFLAPPPGTSPGELAGPEAVKWLIAVAIKVLEALEHVHARGVLHRDLKPSNIMVLAAKGVLSPRLLLADGDPQVKLLDFGLARDRSARGLAGLLAGGTPLYMAPEEIEGDPGAGERADLYSLGALLYHLLAGEPPFASVSAILSRRSRPPPPSARNPRLSRAAGAAVLSLMAREPHRRPPAAAEAKALLLPLLDARWKAKAAAARLLSPPFVGRAAELDRARALLARAAGGAGGALHMSGEAGAGKTWFLERSPLKGEALADHGLVPIRGACRPAGPVNAGLRDVVEGLLGLIRAASGAAGVEAALHPWGHHLLETLGLREPAPAAPAGPPASSERVERERLIAAAAQVFRAAAAAQPVLILLDDVQDAGDFETDAIQRFERLARESRAAVVLAYRRPGKESSPLGTWLAGAEAEGAFDEVQLDALSDRDVKEIAESMLRPAGEASPRLLSLLAQGTEGKPLSVTRRIEALWERGAIRRTGGIWDLTEAPARREAGLDGLWADRLRALDRLEGQALRAAAALGTPFDEDLLAAALGADPSSGDGEAAGDPARISSAVRALLRKGVLVEVPEGYITAGDLDETTLWSGIPAAQARAAHARAGEALLAWTKDAGAGRAFHVAERFERAGLGGKAAALYLDAARHAARHYANRRGIEAYRRALALAPEGEARRRMAEELGDLHARVGEYGAAIERLREAFPPAMRETALGGEDGGGAPRLEPGARPLDRLVAGLLDKAGRVFQRQGDRERARAIYSRVLAGAGEDRSLRAQALFRLGGIHLEAAELVEARRRLEESLEIHEAIGDQPGAAAVRSHLGLVEKGEDRLDAAVARFEEALRSTEAAGSLIESATNLNNLGNVHRARGDDARAIECLRRSIEARERVGDRPGLAICLNNLARVHVHRGELEAARKATGQALAIFEEIGDGKGVLIACSNLGEVLHLEGSFAAARALLEGNLKRAEKLKVQRTLEATLCNLAALHLDVGEYEAAREVARACLRTLPEEKPLELRAQALGVAAAACLRLGDLEGAEDAIREALDVAAALKLREKLPSLVSRRMRWHLERGEPEQAIAAGEPFAGGRGAGIERVGAAELRLELGRAYRDLGPDWADRTEKHLLGAREEFASMGSPHNEAAARAEIGVYWLLLGEEEEGRVQLDLAAGTFRRLGAPKRAEEVEALGRSA